MLRATVTLCRSTLHRATSTSRGFLTTTPPVFNKQMSPHRGTKKTPGRDKRGNRISSTDNTEEDEEEVKGADPLASLDTTTTTTTTDTATIDPNDPIQIEVDENGTPIEIFIRGEQPDDDDSRKSVRQPKKKKRTQRSSSFNQTDFEGIKDNEERRKFAKGDFMEGANLHARVEERPDRQENQQTPEPATDDHDAKDVRVNPTPVRTTEYPPMPVHPKPRDLCLPVDDYDLHNPWGDLDDLHAGMTTERSGGYQFESSELDDMIADANELKDMRKYSLENEDELIAYYREMQEKSSSNAYNVPMLSRQEMYDMHKSDPLEWTSLKLSREFGIKKKRVETIIQLFDLRSSMKSEYVRHEVEDLIVEMEMLCGTASITTSHNKHKDNGYIHPEMDVHYDRNEVSKKFVQLNDLETRKEAQETLVESHELSQREAKGKPSPVLIAEHETKRGRKIRFTEL